MPWCKYQHLLLKVNRQTLELDNFLSKSRRPSEDLVETEWLAYVTYASCMLHEIHEWSFKWLLCLTAKLVIWNFILSYHVPLCDRCKVYIFLLFSILYAVTVYYLFNTRLHRIQGNDAAIKAITGGTSQTGFVSPMWVCEC